MPDKEKVPCPICGKLFDKRGLNGHLRSHENQDAPEEPEQNHDEDINFIFDEQEEPEQNQEGDTKYKCECGTTLTEGQNPCPGCGGVFEW